MEGNKVGEMTIEGRKVGVKVEGREEEWKGRRTVW